MTTLLEQFLVPVDRFSFSDTQFKQLEATCLAQKEATEYHKITSYSSIAMSEKGFVMQRFRFTKPALRKYCQELCKKLYPLIITLLEDDTNQNSTALVVDLLNRVAAARGKKLMNWSFIVDTRKMAIIGLVSPRYYSVSNTELLRHVSEYMSKDVALGFHDGTLHHRRMSMRFLTGKPVFTLPVRASVVEPYFAGFYFANSETGDCAIHACQTLVRGMTKGAATSMAKDDSGWLPHVKTKSFVQKLFELIDSTRIRPEKIRLVRAQLLRMKETRLGFTPENHQRLFDKFLVKLQAGGLTADVARSLMTRAVVEGSYAFEKLRPQDAVKVAATKRTFYDLFTAMTLESRRLPPVDREVVEGLAYRLLDGKFLFS